MRPLTLRPQDDAPLPPEARRALAASHFDHALSLASDSKRRWPHLADDFDSAAGLATAEAAASFDPARRVPFRHWLRCRVRCGLRQVLRDQVPKGYGGDPGAAPTVSSLPPGHAGGRVVAGGGPAPDPAAGPASAEAFETYLAKLPAVNAAAVAAVYRDGCWNGEAAARLGLPVKELRKVLKASLDALRADPAVAANDPRPYSSDPSRLAKSDPRGAL